MSPKEKKKIEMKVLEYRRLKIKSKNQEFKHVYTDDQRDEGGSGYAGELRAWCGGERGGERELRCVKGVVEGGFSVGRSIEGGKDTWCVAAVVRCSGLLVLQWHPCEPRSLYAVQAG